MTTKSHWQRQLKMIQRSGQLSHSLGMGISVLFKCPPNQIKLQILCHPYQSIHDIFHSTRTNNPNTYMGSQKTKDLELPKQSCAKKQRCPDFRQFCQATVNKQHGTGTKTDRSRQQDSDTRIKLTCLWSINLWHRKQEYIREKRQSFQQVVLGKLDIHMSINEVRTPPHTTHKNKLVCLMT